MARDLNRYFGNELKSALKDQYIPCRFKGGTTLFVTCELVSLDPSSNDDKLEL